MKSNPKLKSIRTPWQDPKINPSSPSPTKRTKNHQLRQPTKRSENHHKKGPKITKNEASSVVGSPPSLDLDLCFSKSLDLPGWVVAMSRAAR
jgi:hypothetical protein